MSTTLEILADCVAVFDKQLALLLSEFNIDEEIYIITPPPIVRMNAFNKSDTN